MTRLISLCCVPKNRHGNQTKLASYILHKKNLWTTASNLARVEGIYRKGPIKTREAIAFARAVNFLFPFSSNMRNTGFFKVGILFCWYGSLILNGVFLIDFFTAYLFKTQIISSQLKFCWCRLRLSWWDEDETTQIWRYLCRPGVLFTQYPKVV